MKCKEEKNDNLKIKWEHIPIPFFSKIHQILHTIDDSNFPVATTGMKIPLSSRTEKAVKLID